MALGSATAIAGTVMGLAPLATAQPAEAYSASRCTTWVQDGGITVDNKMQRCNLNFNWAEEFFLLKRDGWYLRECNMRMTWCGNWYR